MEHFHRKHRFFTITFRRQASQMFMKTLCKQENVMLPKQRPMVSAFQYPSRSTVPSSTSSRPQSRTSTSASSAQRSTVQEIPKGASFLQVMPDTTIARQMSRLNMKTILADPRLSRPISMPIRHRWNISIASSELMESRWETTRPVGSER